MAYDPREAVGIIGALSDAGLLRPAVSATPESSGVSEAARIIGALRDAGLLGTGTVGAPAPPEPMKEPQVGDNVSVRTIVQVFKRVDSGGAKRIGFLSKQDGGRWWQVECDFPPNDSHWLVEIDKVLASPKPSILTAEVEVTHVMSASPSATFFTAKLMEFQGLYRTPALPSLTY